MLFVFKNKLIAFWQVLNAEQHEAAKRNEYNFDHPGKNNKILNFQFYQWRELQSNLHYWTVLKKGHLSPTATFFFPQGGHFEQVQL